MNLLDHARIASATLDYDLWLDLAGVPGRRRRESRRELRANLADATALVGSRQAVRNLGSLREMAAAGNPPDRTRPRWTVGFTVGLSLSGVVWFVQLLASLSWIEGVLAAAPESDVMGSLVFFPGSSVSYSPLPGGSATGFGFSMDFGWTGLIVGVIAFVLVAQPWRRLLRRRASRP